MPLILPNYFVLGNAPERLCDDASRNEIALIGSRILIADLCYEKAKNLISARQMSIFEFLHGAAINIPSAISRYTVVPLILISIRQTCNMIDRYFTNFRDMTRD